MNGIPVPFFVAFLYRICYSVDRASIIYMGKMEFGEEKLVMEGV